ncbi:MAG TPA: signal peptidase I [Bacteroidales bacterium]|nr:signal peptidase I [Bacteroidales bacterium]HOR81866.1 signal peptidase I [Bacteroidales bacterium]HPJ92090.1 signal peptidase I [Bacteroidales bacterium]
MEHDNKEKTIQKKPWVAGLLSWLLPGLGHFYIGQIKKAIGFHAGIWIYFLLVWFLPLGHTFSGLIILICLGLTYFIIILINAIIATKKNKTIVRKKYDKWYVYLLIILAIGILFEFVYLPAKKKLAYVQLANSQTTAMSPTLTIGDNFTWLKTQTIEKGNIVVFEFPKEPNILYVYRCVASPGDKLEIKQGQVFINNKLSDNPKQLKFCYSIQTDGNLEQSYLQQLGLEEIFQIPEGYMSFLTTGQVEELKKIKNVTHVNATFMTEGTPMNELFPFDPNLKWNTDFYGPLTLPKKGQNIKIDKENAVLYGTIIQTCENESQIELNEQGLLVINEEIVTSYTFKHDYYFMMGDNRHNAADSRYKGLVPDNLIKGKALYIWWSNNKEKIGKKIKEE